MTPTEKERAALEELGATEYVRRKLEGIAAYNEAVLRLECSFCGAPVVDDHGPHYDPTSAKAEGAREERERILAIVRDTSHDWLEIETRLGEAERESSLGRDTEGHLVLTLGPGAESPSRKKGWEQYDGLSPLEQRHADGDR